MKTSTWSKLPDWIGPLIPWLKGLLAAIMGAVAGAIGDTLLLLLEGGTDPWSSAGRARLLRVVLVTATIAVAGYLTPSPIARKEWSEEERAAKKAKLAAQNRLP